MTSNIAIETSDMDEFVALINRVFGHHRILSLGGPRAAASLQAHSCSTLMIGQLQYGVEVSVDVDEERQGWVVTHALGADGAWDSSRFGNGDLMMYPPDWLGRIDMAANTQMRNTYLPRGTMDEALHSLLGAQPDQPIVFAPRMAPDGPQAERLRCMVDLMYTAGGSSPAFTPLLQQSWQRTFAMELLSAWPHSFSRHLKRATLAPRALRRACDYIEAHLCEPISVADVARAASVGARALELGFAKHIGQSPMRYVRDRRLDAAKQDLIGSAGRSRIADIAHKWGFSSASQFSKVYRERFGELPRSSAASAGKAPR